MQWLLSLKLTFYEECPFLTAQCIDNVTKGDLIRRLLLNRLQPDLLDDMGCAPSGNIDDGDTSSQGTAHSG